MGDIVQTLEQTPHNGFPVLKTDGSICGLIVRRQLTVLLATRIWEMQGDGSAIPLDVRQLFVTSNSHWDQIKDLELNLSDADHEREVDLRTFFDSNPPLIYPTTPLTFVYRLFNTIGVRHIPVIDSRHRVRGIITRKDTFQELIEKRISSHTSRFGPSPRGQADDPPTMVEELDNKMADGSPSKLFLRLTYSSSLSAMSRQVADNQLADIMAAALKNNPALGIGGMLHFNSETLSLIQAKTAPPLPALR